MGQALFSRSRHSLIAYLLHQPVIYAVLWLWFALIA